MLTKLRNTNIFDVDVEALVNPVNCVGVMGSGLALQFKNRFPFMYELYKKYCEENLLKIGEMYVVKINNDIVDKSHFENLSYIINFPTKYHWKDDRSNVDDIRNGLDSLIKVIDNYNIKSIAIPMLGCGCGKLNKFIVSELITAKMLNTKAEVIILE